MMLHDKCQSKQTLPFFFYASGLNRGTDVLFLRLPLKSKEA